MRPRRLNGARFVPLWDRYRNAIFFTPGNHDIWSPASRVIYEQQTGRPAFYSFNYQNAHFTVLDNSEAPDPTGDLSDQQMQFLARDLAQNRDRDPKFVFFHKPFWLIPVKFQSSHFPFHQLIAKYGVRYVVSGHGHQYVFARAGWHHLSRSAQFGRQVERTRLRAADGSTARFW